MTTIDDARRDLGTWAGGGEDAVFSMAEELGATREQVESDPLCLMGLWDRFIERLPMDEMEDDDWVWLQTQVAAYVAFVLIRHHGGRWDVVEDKSLPKGFRYVVATSDSNGQRHEVDPFALTREELRHRPPLVMRAVADAEVEAGVVPRVQP